MPTFHPPSSPSLSFTHSRLFVLTFAAVAMKFSCSSNCACACAGTHAMATSRAQHKANKLCTYTHTLIQAHTLAHTHTHTAVWVMCVHLTLFPRFPLFFLALPLLFRWFLWGSASLSAALGWSGLVWSGPWLTSSYSIWARCRVNLARNIWQDEAL